MPLAPTPPPLAVVSACLLGRPCRYDGHHKLAPTLRQQLEGRGFRILPLCAEADSGLPVPRPPMDLHPAADGSVRCIDVNGIDHTDTLQAWISATVDALRPQDPALFVLKSKSPSCGLRLRPQGLFAAALQKAFPNARFFDETDFSL